MEPRIDVHCQYSLAELGWKLAFSRGHGNDREVVKFIWEAFPQDVKTQPEHFLLLDDMAVFRGDEQAMRDKIKLLEQNLADCRTALALLSK